MRINHFLLGACIFPLMAAIPPAASAAVRVKQCIAGAPTPASYTWSFQEEANNVFQAIQSDAAQAKYHAEKLQSFQWNSGLSWQSHAGQLLRLKQEVSDMGERLCRLETIRRVVAPWQQRTIDRIAESVRLMADNTQNAIVFLDQHELTLWQPTYRNYADNLYAEANSLNQSMADAVEYAKAGPQFQPSSTPVGMRASS